jgi:O-antigen/teichoic acid export membrane protein
MARSETGGFAACMSVFKKLLGDTALYGVSTILSRTINYLLVPIHTYAFGRPAQLASNTEFFAYIAILLALYTIGMETTFFRFATRSAVTDNKLTPEGEVVLSNSLSIVMIISLLPTILLLTMATPITNYLGYPGQELYLRWAALLVAIDAVMGIPFARLRAENRSKRFVQAKTYNIIIVVLLNVFFLIFCRDVYAGKYLTFLQPVVKLIYYPEIGPGYIFLANLIANALYFVMLPDAFRGFRFRIDWPAQRLLLAYALPIMLTNLAGLVNNFTDRLFLKYWLPANFYADLTAADALGIYGQCMKLSVFMSLAIQSFKFAADPFFFSQSPDRNAPGGGPPQLLADVTKWFVIICVIIWVGVSLNLDVLGQMLSPAYRRGLDIVPVLLLGHLFIGIYYNTAFWFKLSDKTQYGTLITAIGAILTVGLNVVLIPIMGYMGCAVAFLGSSVLMTAICYWLGERHYPVPYKVGSALGYIGAGGLLIWLNSFIRIQNLWIAVPYHLILCGLFILAVLLAEWRTFGPVLARLLRQSPPRN